ncbi:MAG: transposase [Planctomycetia bacterium]
MSTTRRGPRRYDHRLVQQVRDAGDVRLATRQGVPRSTAYGWLKRAPAVVTPSAPLDPALMALRLRVTRLEKRVQRLSAALRLLLVLLRVVKPDLSRVRFAGLDKARLLRAVHRTRDVFGLRRALAFVGLSLSRFHAWARMGSGCLLEDQPSCPATSPQRLTPAEVMAMRRMATDEDLRHVPTGRLALLAQRIGCVCASASTWYRFVRERGWRRPRMRLHPHQAVEGIRAEKPNEIWHIDVTVFKLLDGTRAYLSAVIDNFSRKILAWHLSERRCAGSSVAVLLHAGKGLEGAVPTLYADAGSENVNHEVDRLLEAGLLRRVLAQVDVGFSNSMIEALWRSMKHNWLYLNELDSISRLRSLIAFYVVEHNSKIPHGAFQGQTPDEMYAGTGANVPDILKARREAARQARMSANRASQCATCA